MIDNGKILFEEDKDMLLETHRLVKGKGLLPAETKKLFLKVRKTLESQNIKYVDISSVIMGTL